MPSRPVLLAALPLAVLLGAVSASATTQARPRAGSYSGQEAVAAQPEPVSFTVASGRRTITNFIGEAVTKPGCRSNVQAFAPSATMALTRTGKFRGVETTYPRPKGGVRVVVTGSFTSPTMAAGKIRVAIAKRPGCNASHAFNAELSSN